MIRAEALLDGLLEAGFSLVAGVPCSYLTPFIDAAIDDPRMRYVGAANEGDAVAVAAGAQLGGLGAVVTLQNSGLGNAVSPLTSLTAIFRLPVLLVVTWRGRPGGPADEPQHEMMGRITPGLLDLMEIPWAIAPRDEAAIGPALLEAVAHMERHRTPYALVAEKGAFEARGLSTGPAPRASISSDGGPPYAGERVDPDLALGAVQAACVDGEVVLATTGFTGRALYAIGDRPGQFYMVGSMGCVAPFGLGLALARPERRVVVVDGDGSVLMRMGALATIGHEAPTNLTHLVLDNGVHDSTGAQATAASSVDFPALALACGYRSATRAVSAGALAEALADPAPGPTLIHVPTRPRSDRRLPRPTMTPPEVAGRLRAWLEAS